MALINDKKRRLPNFLTFVLFTLCLFLSATKTQAQIEPTFSQQIADQTITFVTLNPYSRATGSMTIKMNGVFYATRLTEPRRAGMLRITGNQNGTFTFVPDDYSQPTISGEFAFTLTGKTQAHTDIIDFDFRMDGTAPDGSAITFIQRERAFVNEGGFDISFGKTQRLVLPQQAPSAVQ